MVAFRMLELSEYEDKERELMAEKDCHFVFASDWLASSRQMSICKNFMAFHIFPRSEQEVRDNICLWEIVNLGRHSGWGEHTATGAEACALLIPKKLHWYLRSVSRSEISASIVEILSDIIDLDESQGTVVRDELAPSVWKELSTKMEMEETSAEQECLSSAYLLDDMLGDLLMPVPAMDEYDNHSPFLKWRVTLNAVVVAERPEQVADLKMTGLLHKLYADLVQCRTVFCCYEDMDEDSLLEIVQDFAARGVEGRQLFNRQVEMLENSIFAGLPTEIKNHHILPQFLLSGGSAETESPRDSVNVEMAS
ncbi:hypothetical protein NDN08_002684 [Rhodosorus marinus]|uniref:Uncharacterized protein n=1 Tax=Rhodosorus marinus TaxID=101924 RepID=A0AAV8UVV3_9RHOD|nr:hypothetical protein NDN08_002684 [Rhodosorus marinus]